jgi:1-deoxyxylulose-5-phosphate synthase
MFLQPMNLKPMNRRQFIKGTLTAAGAAIAGGAAPGCAAAPVRRTGIDQVALGSTGLKLSRLGMGTGSNSGEVQFDLGKESFKNLVHYAYDQGITYFDCAESYRTFEWVGGAIKGLPREKLFILSKIPGQPDDVLQAIDRHRKVFDTDYVDALLIHCMIHKGWTDPFKRIMDGFDTARDKGWIRSKGVSCHSLPALRTAADAAWSEVHLVRVNPQGRRLDGEEEEVWNDRVNSVAPVVEQLQAMKAKGRGVIGMKIIGNGEFTSAEDRERSIRWAMSRPELDSIVVGFKNRAEIDEAIRRMNDALRG